MRDEFYLSKIQEAFRLERTHWDDLDKKYTVYCMDEGSDLINEGDVERVIKCLMSHYQEDEDQIIARLEKATIDEPVPMLAETFWFESRVKDESAEDESAEDESAEDESAEDEKKE